MDLGLGNLSDLKTHLLNESLRGQTQWDQTIANLGKGVAARFDKICNRNFSRVVGATADFSADRTHYILPRFPVETITKVESRDSLVDGWVELPINDVIQNRRDDAGLIDFVVQRAWEHSFLRITYTGGYWYPTSSAVVLQRDTITIPLGAAALDVEFPEAFAAAPFVRCTLIAPDGGEILSVQPEDVDQASFTVRLGAPTPLAGYQVAWIAIDAAGAETDSTSLQQGSAALALNDESKAIVFPTAFSAVPIVFCNIVSPAGGIIIESLPVVPTVNGFTAAIAFPIPAGGYTLDWLAILPTAVAAAQSIPVGATALPDDLKLAWLMQCQAIWAAIDPTGLGLGNAEAQAKVMDSLSRTQITPFVAEVLQGLKRYSMT